VLKGRTLSLLFGVLAPLALAACGGHTNVSRAAGGCDEQIILSLAPGFDRTDRVIKGLSKGARVQLEYLRSASPNLHVFQLTTKGKDPQCQDALARLRQDSRVRFAEPDNRRMHFDAAR
jgi:hypothetical protein